MILQIKRGNKVVAESADFSYSPSLQEVRKLTCEVVSVVPIEFKAYNSKSESEYDTVVYNGNTFILYQAPSGDNLNEAGKYKYSLLFYGKEVLLQNVAFLDIVSGTGGEINKIRYTHGGLFQFWGDAKQLAARIEANIQSYNASLGAGYTGIGTWTLNVDAEGELTEDMIDITDGTNLFEALKFFYDKFYLNYYFSTTANGGIITITDKTRPSVNWTFKQGDGGGAVKVSSSVDTSTPVITRIIPQGGSRNVPPEYKKDAKPADESRYCPYILLPNDSDGNIRYYIDSEYGLKNYGVRGKTISNTFSGIYPSIRGKKLGDLYPSGLPEWDTYKADGEPDPQSGKVAGEGASASTRIDKIIGSTPIKSDDSDSFFIYMTSPGFNLGYKVYEDGDSSDKINDNVQPQYKPHAMFDKYRDFESFDIYGTRAYYDQPVKVTATFSGKMLFSILPIGSDAVGKKVKINLRMVLNRVLGQASPLKEVVIGEEGATGMLEIPYDKTALVGYIEKGQNTTVTIRVEFTFDSDIPAESCKIGFSEEMTCNIHFGNQDGSQDRFYYKYASVTDAVFSMRTGTYTGTEFKINKNGIIPLYGEVNGDTGETEEDVAMFNKGARYKISCYRTDSDNAKLPLYTDGKSPSIAEGTEFVILNIVMPESYVTMAENTLEKAALDYLSRYDHENRTVSLDISSGFVAEHPSLFIDFLEGNMLKVRDDGIGVFDLSDNGQIVDMQLQIQSLEIKYSKDNMFPSYSCTIARRKILSFYERLAQENQTASTQNTTNITLGGSGTGSGTGSGGGSSNITNADHAKSAYTLDDDTPVLNWFLSALNNDDAQGIINFLKGLKISGNLINRIVKQGDMDVTYTDEDVMSALRVMVEIENSVEKMKEIFLRKDVADSTKFLLSMFAGAVFGKNGFASGLTGFGAKIFDTGHGEFESMFIRRFLEVPELRYNRVMVTLGDKWRAPGAGIIETVDTGTKTCTLKLEDGEIGAVAVGDICMGIYHNITGNATEDYDDGKGNRRFAGFCTVYFTITEVTGERNETFKYQLRPTSSSWSSSFDPFEMMNFVAYGNFTDTDRQTSVYETRTYTRMLWKQNTWEISAANVALQYGDLSNLNIFGLNMDGYSMYLNNIYMTGIIKQIKPDGTPVQTLNFREEGYIPGVHYDYYDSLSYNGSMWACINEDGSSAAPGSNGDWLEIASKGDTGAPGAPGKDGVSVTNSGPWYSGLVVPKMSIVTMGGSSFLSKVSTTNPPLWCWTDNAGNRFTFNDGGYCLTGEINTDEYELLVQSGKDGRDAKDHEFIFTNTTTNTRPSTPETSQTDDYVPSGWNDDPVGVSASIPYEWVSKRTKKDGIWGAFSTPEPWANHSFNAISADLDNQMDNAALDENGKTVDEVSITTTASMWNGATKLSLSSISVQSVTGVTSSYDLSTGDITLSVAKGTALADRTEISITVKAMADGVEQSRVLKFTLAGVRGGKNAVLYSLVTSASNIVKKKDGTYSVSGISATRMKTVGGVSEVTTDGTLIYAIDNGSEISTSNGASIPSSSISSKIIFSFYDAKGVLVDIESVPMIQDGVDGQGYTQMGQFKTGMVVPKMGVVSMGGGSYVAKASTTNPPLWCWTDNVGNRFTFNDGGYCLTGEVNTAEYDVWAEKGDTGEKGDKGDDGEKGDKGDKGDQGVQGIQGCIIRSSEWKTGVTYRNDESLTSGTRYIDIVMVRNNSAVDGWDVYKCIKTHTSSSSITYTNTTYWTELSNVGPIYTSLIIAKNASLDFVQGNELIIKDSNNNVVAGLTGGESKEAGTTPVRIWAGGGVPGSAPFRVDQEGNLVATKANITGTITATGGNIGGFNISTSSMESVSGNNAMLLSANLVRFTGSYSSVFIGADTFPSSSGGAILCPSRISVNRNITNTAYGNVGMYFDIQGSHAYDDNNFQYTGNHALYIVKGDICGFRLRLRRISKSTTLSVMDSVIMAVTSGITLTVPSTAEDGQFYWIRNVSGGDVTIAGTNLVGWNSGEVSTSIGLAKSKAAAMYYDKHNNKWFMNWIDCWN
jgi:hypothetical protein